MAATSLRSLLSSTLSRCFSSTKENTGFQTQSILNGLNEIKETAASSPRVTTSSLLLPVKPISENQASICSHKLMLRMGLIRQSCPGIYHLLPMGLRALEKLITLIDQHMRAIGAVKIAMPIVTPSALWKKSGRWDDIGSELFQLKDRGENLYCLGPTHEEVVTNLIKEELISRKQLPLKLYQLDRKFRDEVRPRYGLLRAREFWMKDMYSFDETVEDAVNTYQLVCRSYERIFKQLNLPILKVNADPGDIGGSLSHEYHIPSNAGENTIKYCRLCNMCSSEEMVGDTGLLGCCPHPESRPCDLSETKGTEVAHVFFLGTKYSDLFDLQYSDHDGNKSMVQMGCYGIGVSRILAAVIEYGCKHQSEYLVWPRAIAPYTICITPMAKCSSGSIMKKAMELYDILSSAFPGDVVLEDRLHLSMGARIRELKSNGYPVGIVVGDKVPEGNVELHLVNNFEHGEHVVQTNNLVNYLNSYL